MEPTPEEVAAAFGEAPHAQPGSIVEHGGERRVVVDISEDGWAVLRYTDDDPRREVDDEGGDIHLTAAAADSLTVVGHI